MRLKNTVQLIIDRLHNSYTAILSGTYIVLCTLSRCHGPGAYIAPLNGGQDRYRNGSNGGGGGPPKLSFSTIEQTSRKQLIIIKLNI